MNRRNLIFGAAGLALAGGFAAYLLPTPSDPKISADALTKLRATPFKDLQGIDTPLTRWSNRVLVVNFWATWCPPCRKEMPAFSNLQNKLGPSGVQFIGIGIDSPSAIKEYALQYPVSYPLLVGGSEGMDVLRQLGNPNASLPFTLVLDRQGQAIFSTLGMIEEALFEARLQPLLSPG